MYLKKAKIITKQLKLPQRSRKSMLAKFRSKKRKLAQNVEFSLKKGQKLAKVAKNAKHNEKKNILIMRMFISILTNINIQPNNKSFKINRDCLKRLIKQYEDFKNIQDFLFYLHDLCFPQ